jgi:membrane-associated protein
VSGNAAGANTRAGMHLPDLQALLHDLAETLGPWTYLLVFGMAFLETGAFVGLLAPGETAILLGGVVAAQGKVSLALILLLAWIGSAAGDIASFALGRRLGRPFLHRHGPRFKLTEPRIERVEHFYARHGGKAILIGRFIGIVRAVSPFIAGASGLALRTFLPYSLLGTAAWSSAYTLLGYVGGASDTFTHLTLAAAVLFFAGFAIAHRSSRRRTRASRPAR